MAPSGGQALQGEKRDRFPTTDQSDVLGPAAAAALKPMAGGSVQWLAFLWEIGYSREDQDEWDWNSLRDALGTPITGFFLLPPMGFRQEWAAGPFFIWQPMEPWI